MKCPKCSNDMEEGYAKVHGTIGGFLFFGMSHQNLYFKGKDHEEMVAPSNEEVDGYRCKECNITLLEGESHMTQRYMSIGKSLGEKYGKWKHGNK